MPTKHGQKTTTATRLRKKKSRAVPLSTRLMLLKMSRTCFGGRALSREEHDVGTVQSLNTVYPETGRFQVPSTFYFKLDSVGMQDIQDNTPSPSPSDIVLDPAILPRNSTTFFDNWPHANPLPTPAQIRSSTFDSPYQVLHHRPHGAYAQRVLHIPDLGLVIKHGPRTTVVEGQTLCECRRYMGGARTAMRTFIYVSYIDGVTLDSRLDTLSDDELKDIAGQVPPMIASIRDLRQPRSTDRGPIRDPMWWGGYHPPPTAPFLSVKAFNDALFALADHLPMFPDHEFFQTFRSSFSDTSSIRLTHTDLATSNIIISRTSTETGRKAGGTQSIGSTSRPSIRHRLDGTTALTLRCRIRMDSPYTVGKKIQAVGAPQFGSKIELSTRKVKLALPTRSAPFFSVPLTLPTSSLTLTESSKSSDLNTNDKYDNVADTRCTSRGQQQLQRRVCQRVRGCEGAAAAALQHGIPGMRRCQD
ncbi:hypothetical protein B0H34DRAFT_675045 [Crassisporium funariophilum]|nr:hypothetical protein B0H34DRAFT_675045 [Crassisporium funariophilum]